MKNEIRLMIVCLVLDIAIFVVALGIDYSVVNFVSGVGSAVLVFCALDIMIGIHRLAKTLKLMYW